MNGEMKYWYIPWMKQSWMDDQELVDGLDMMKSVMGTRYIVLMNIL